MKVKERKEIYRAIEQYATKLRLPMIRTAFEACIKQAQAADAAYEEVLLELLEKEWDKRQESGKETRIRAAQFPFRKYLEDIEQEALPEDAGKKFKLLGSLEFIKEGQNVILAGNPGMGKTHMAIGLGIWACMQGYKVLFTTVPLLVTQLKESRSEQMLRMYSSKFEKYDLVIADELGYISYDKEGCELLFTHLSLRCARKSTIITTNLSFERWSEIFLDPVLTAAMVDRLTHKAYLVNMNGNSYRLKETKSWMEK